MRLVPLLALVLVGCATQKTIQPWSEVRGIAEPGTLRHLVQGDVTGFTEPQGTQAWLGLPYAEPPQRWKAPRAAKPWQGVHEAVKYRRGRGALSARRGIRRGVRRKSDALTLPLSRRERGIVIRVRRFANLLLRERGEGNALRPTPATRLRWLSGTVRSPST